MAQEQCPPNWGVLRASSSSNHTKEPQLGTSGVPENACPCLQVGCSIISVVWVILNPRAELWPSTLLCHKTLAQVPIQRRALFGSKGPGASTHLPFQQLPWKQG